MLKQTIRAICGTMLCVVLIAGACAFPVPFAHEKSDLTPAQRAKMAEIERKGRSELQAAQLSLGTKEQKTARVKAIIQKYRDAEMAVLTPAQQKRALAIRAQREKQLRQTLAVQKTITPQQRAKANALRMEFSRKARAVAQNKKLTDAQKRLQIMDLQKTMDRGLTAILTPQQRALLPIQK